MEAKVELKQFRCIGDARGQLVALEALGEIVPFEVKWFVLFIYGFTSFDICARGYWTRWTIWVCCRVP